MKKIIIYIMLLGIAGSFWACKEDDLSSKSIFVDPEDSGTPFDQWLLENYSYPYNIAFKYKTEDIETNKTYEVVPAEVDKAVIMAKLLKYLWLEVYDEIAGVNFTRTYVPRVIHLIGSGEYNTNNTVVLGSAEGGMKITLTRINDLSPQVTGEYLNQNYMKTIHHEFAHILHQTKNYSEDFQHITGSDYIGDEWSNSANSEAVALQKGFISRYSRKDPNEDFVELIAYFVTRDQAWWDSKLSAAGATGAALINEKFEIATDYLKNSWNIDIYKLRDIVEYRSNNIHKIDLSNLN